MSVRGMIATMTIEAATDAEIFLAYLDQIPNGYDHCCEAGYYGSIEPRHRILPIFPLRLQQCQLRLSIND